MSAAFLRAGAPQAPIATVSQQARALLAGECFARVRDMMTALETVRDAGLACFLNAAHLTGGGGEEACDLRDRDRGAGRRVIVEMAFVWE